ncbi:MAG: amidohydrolase family protein [Pseudomonadales bacterium]
MWFKRSHKQSVKAIQPIVLAGIGALSATVASQADTLIHAGRLLDGEANRVVTEKTIRVSGATITTIEDGYTTPSNDDAVVDLKNHTVLPGLMDMHTHISSEYSPNRRLEKFILNAADYTINAVANARKTLDAGFTVIRDLGDSRNVTVAVRNAINKGTIPGPKIFTAAKSLATTGGHADPTNGWAKHLMGAPGPNEGVVNSVEGARQAVRQRYKDGADWIKITATGGVLSVAKSGQNPQFMDDELQAIIATATDYGMRVAAHAHGAEGMKRAIIAGVASIEHGTYMTDEIIKLMKQRGTFYVPTIMAGAWVGEKSKIDGFFPELVRPKAATIGPLIQETFAKAYKAGIPIVFGTDTGVSAHGDNAQEFGLMVDAGMPPMEAIQSATSIAAKFLEIEDTHGTLKSGKQADIIAVEGDPLQNIRVMEQVGFVMKGGVIYKQ